MVRGEQRQSGTMGAGLALLLALNFAIFLADHWMGWGSMKVLYLNHAYPKWFQFVTCAFCHNSWQHLSGNAFFLYVFGRVVEEEEGPWGLWGFYLLTGCLASVASYLVLPKTVQALPLGVSKAATVSLGASGAVFGLFSVAVLTRLSLDPRRLLETGVLGQFVFERFLSEARTIAASKSAATGGISHVAHLAGALSGVLLVFLLSRLLPPDSPSSDASSPSSSYPHALPRK